jgi:hypothetical protein
MAWVAEIQKHVDYFKDQDTDTTTLLAATEEDAKKLAVLHVLEVLDDSEFRPFTSEGEGWYKGVTDDMKKAMLSRDANQMFEVLTEHARKVFKGEYVSPRLEIEIYERSDDYDEFDEEAFQTLCDSARSWIDVGGELVPITEDEEERLYDEDGGWVG